MPVSLAAPTSVSPSTAASSERRSRAVEDAARVAAVAGGDEQALAELWGRYRRPCLQVARRVLGSGRHTEDVVQLVFLDAWRQADRFDPARASVASWLLSMTHHKAVDRVRHEGPRAAVSLDVSAEHADVDQCMEQAAEKADRRDLVRRALQTLSEPQRETLVLAYFGGYTYREIAVLIGAPLGTVKSRGRTGLIQLRLQLEHLHGAVHST